MRSLLCAKGRNWLAVNRNAHRGIEISRSSYAQGAPSRAKDRGIHIGELGFLEAPMREKLLAEEKIGGCV